ncbi:peptide/nickel transport system ATP-binding protein [Paraburkholderia unamae]|uniref:dipeptide ABC transporter ATP-binding protein n=1 Tax=Paraburkholderia unamae TaxID=219649 RepID=UPI000DC5A8C6|nr:ABC transporter ATP-binding protein [Paraburkholderia unamae]RAR62588.1 peptide/nickel transport system ATP-binding protein [Paraburkholderia unamae]
MPLLDIEQLEVDFVGPRGAEPAVRGVTLSLEAGEIVALVGESGSGKSVTAAAINGLLPRGVTRVRGSITFDGQPLVGIGEAQLERLRGTGVATIFQNPLSALDPTMRIGDQLAVTARLRRPLTRAQALARATKALAEVGIDDPARTLRAWPHQLSGGMRQRVMIALATLNHPRLLIADEPTTALDAVLQKDILRLLKRLNQEHGVAILIITHDFGVVAELSQRVAVMRAGRIVEQGRTADVLAAPKHAYTRSLIDAVPEIGLRALDPSPSRRLGAAGAGGQKRSAGGTNTSAPANAAPVLLEARGVRRTFVTARSWLPSRARRFDAVIDARLEVRRGEIFGLIGASGSGKSTLARVVAHLIPASEGTVRFDGADLATLDGSALKAFRRRFQFVFQDSASSLNPRRTLLEQLADPALRLGVARDREHARELAQEALERVGLEARHLNRYPHAFSGGQRQRIGIARALVVKPEFIVLDEPTSALDVSIQAQILNLLLALRESLGLTYLFIGHSLPVIEFLCDRVAVMERGRIIETLDAANLRANARHPSTLRLLDAVLPVRVAAPASRAPLTELSS